jgi:hypothetical protein
VVALAASALTLFSGFGLGSVMMPVFALFFPLEMAVAATAVAHLLNNIFKVGLVGKHADMKVVAAFAIPGAAAAFAGALALNMIAGLPPVAEYELWGQTRSISPIALVISMMMIVFSLFELLPSLQKVEFEKKWLPLGGAMSGFIGGISGHQGALRSTFLAKAGLTKEVFIGTGVVSAVIVDISRLLVYGFTFFSRDFHAISESGGTGLIAAATLAAFAGSFAGSRLMKKVTLDTVKYIVGAMLFILAIALGSGIV